MDESELFPGFGRPEDRRQEDGTPRGRKRATRAKPKPGAQADADPAATPAPPTVIPAPAATPAPPARWITHEDLAAPTLSH